MSCLKYLAQHIYKQNSLLILEAVSLRVVPRPHVVIPPTSLFLHHAILLCVSLTYILNLSSCSCHWGLSHILPWSLTVWPLTWPPRFTVSTSSSKHSDRGRRDASPSVVSLVSEGRQLKTPPGCSHLCCLFSAQPFCCSCQVLNCSPKHFSLPRRVIFLHSGPYVSSQVCQVWLDGTSSRPSPPSIRQLENSSVSFLSPLLFLCTVMVIS